MRHVALMNPVARQVKKMSPNTKLAIGLGVGAAVVGGIALAVLNKPAAAATNPPPNPPSPPPPAPGPVVNPPSGAPGLVASSLSKGQSYSFVLSTTDTNNLGNNLTAAGITGAIVQCTLNLCFGSFIWNGTDGAAPPVVANTTWTTLTPSATGLGATHHGGGGHGGGGHGGGGHGGGGHGGGGHFHGGGFPGGGWGWGGWGGYDEGDTYNYYYNQATQSPACAGSWVPTPVPGQVIQAATAQNAWQQTPQGLQAFVGAMGQIWWLMSVNNQVNGWTCTPITPAA